MEKMGFLIRVLGLSGGDWLYTAIWGWPPEAEGWASVEVRCGADVKAVLTENVSSLSASERLRRVLTGRTTISAPWADWDVRLYQDQPGHGLPLAEITALLFNRPCGQKTQERDEPKQEG